MVLKPSIAVKATVGLLVLVLLGCATLLSVLDAVRSSRAALREVVEVRQPISGAAYEMEINVIGFGLAVLNYLATADADALGRVAGDRKDYTTFKAVYDRLGTHDQERAMANQIDELFGRYDTLGQTLIDDSNQRTRLMQGIDSTITSMDELLDRRVEDRREAGAPVSGALADLTEIELEVAEVTGWFGVYLRTNSTRDANKLLANVEELDGHLLAYARRPLGPNGRSLATDLQRQAGAVTGGIREAIGVSERLITGTNQFFDLRRQLDDLLDEGIQAVSDSMLAAAEARASRAGERAGRLVLVSVPGLLVGGLLLAAVLARTVRRPLAALVDATAAVRGGDLAHRLDDKRRDEFGPLVQNFNAMVGELEATTVSKERLEASESRLQSTVGSLEREIEQRRQVELLLSVEEDRAQVTLDSIGEGVIATDAAGRVQYLNRLGRALTGWSEREAQGRRLTEVYRCVADGPAASGAGSRSVGLDDQDEPPAGRVPKLLLDREGRQTPVVDTVSPILGRNGDVLGSVVVFRDVSTERALASRLEHQANHDSLTGLANRRLFEERLRTVLGRVEVTGQSACLCFLDLDQFKLVNDSAGHSAGDEMLRQVAAVFASQLRRGDLLARLGGDEFALLLEDCPVDQGVRVAESLRRRVEQFQFAWEQSLFRVRVSIGVVEVSEGSDVTSVLGFADTACQAAKEKGRNRVQVYEVGDDEVARRRGHTQWAQRVTRALDEGRFRLFAQPLVAVRQADDGERFEVLLRLDDEGVLTSPMAFLPAAERYDLMPQVDRWVLRHALQTIGPIYRDPDRSLASCAINLSGATFKDDDFVDYALTEIAASGVDPTAICFEITETAAVTSFSQLRRFIDELHAAGCSFALDDFGTGLSSFSYLRNLPVDQLKIDGSFVREMAVDEAALTVVDSATRVAHVMGMEATAEWVESEAIFNRLRDLGVDYAQGWWVGGPRPLDELARSR